MPVCDKCHFPNAKYFHPDIGAYCYECAREVKEELAMKVQFDWETPTMVKMIKFYKEEIKWRGRNIFNREEKYWPM